MTLIWPAMLLLLGFVPIFIALYLGLQQRRRRAAARYSSLGLVQAGTGLGRDIRRHIPVAFFFAGLIILVIALARPQAVVSLPRWEGTIILAFDVSGSMAADDLKPTRMEAAKTAAREFVQHLPSGVQVGVVVFSDSGFSVQTPTNDQDTILATINRLAPQRGTSLWQGIITSINTILVDMGQDPIDQTAPSDSSIEPPLTPHPVELAESAIIILLSDGENNMSPDPLIAAHTASDYGVRIYTIGIGSPEGTSLHIDGFSVHTQLDEVMLQRISLLTGGDYYNAQSEEELQKIYNDLVPQLVIKPEKMEITSLFVGASILTLLVGGFFSLLWFNRMP